jgi:FkbM family methyltransferase
MNQIFTPIVWEPLKHLAKLVIQPNYRRYHWQYAKLGSRPRYRRCSTVAGRWRLELVDSASFLSAYRSIFVEEIFRFSSSKDDLNVLDCGANIGLAAFYIKSRFPRATVTAFEPDPEVCEVLRQNVIRNKLQGVSVNQKAVWTQEGTVKFAARGADAGRIALAHDSHDLIEVPTVRLRDFLHAPVDFLKIDIEGAEMPVIEDCADRLSNVERLFVEYHSFDREPQILGELLGILQDAGFRYLVQSVNASHTPFLTRPDQDGMDQQLNIFAYRSHN